MSKLSEKLRQKNDRATTAMSMANIAVLHKEAEERDSIRAT